MLDPEDIQAMYEVYKADFKMFGYNMDILKQ